MTPARPDGDTIDVQIDCMSNVKEFNFKHFQVIQDLKAVARRASGAGYARIAVAVPGGTHSAGRLQLELGRIVDGDGRIPPDILPDLFPCLLLVASMPQDDEIAFEAATAILLIDRIQGGSSTDDMGWHWSAFASHYRAADAPVRAALMQGFALCADVRLLNLKHPPGPIDLITEEADTVCEGLLDTVLRTARNDDVGRQLVALAESGNNDQLQVQPESTASSVVEMVSQEPDHPRFLPCLALLCLRAIRTGAQGDDIAARWRVHAPKLVMLPQIQLRPVIDGIRHLFETLPDWNPYRLLSDEELAQQATPIPWLGAA